MPFGKKAVTGFYGSSDYVASLKQIFQARITQPLTMVGPHAAQRSDMPGRTKKALSTRKNSSLTPVAAVATLSFAAL